MQLPNKVYVLMEKDEDGEWLVAHKTIEEIKPSHIMIIGVYELKETVLLRKENYDRTRMDA